MAGASDADVVLLGRSSSHFTRVARIFAAEIGVTCEFQVASDLMATDCARFGGNPARNLVAGHSAGGHLAAMLLACDGRRLANDLPMRLTRRAVSISGLYDLAPIAATPSLQVDLRLTPDVVARTSPATFAAPAGALLASVVGALESEEFLRQNRLIQERWGEAVVPVCDELPGRNHFNVLDELVEPQTSLHQRALKWLGD